MPVPHNSAPCLESGSVSGDVRRWSDDPLTARTRSIWSGADFLPIARSFEAGAEAFIERLNIRPGNTVLDVACCTGNLALPAARAGARVWGVDIAPNLIVQARLEARNAGLQIEFDVGDAECMPYEDGRFDLTISMFGAMFAPHPERAGAELLRVTRPGGRIALANWTPTGFVGEMLRAHAEVVPPPEGLPSPLRWGEQATVEERLGKIRELTCERRTCLLSFRMPPADVARLFGSYYGPTVATLHATDAPGRQRLMEALTLLFHDHNLARDGVSTVVAGEYLAVLGVVP